MKYDLDRHERKFNGEMEDTKNKYESYKVLSSLWNVVYNMARMITSQQHETKYMSVLKRQ